MVNFQYEACDINCCCDNDCSDSERSLLNNCEENGKASCKAHNTDSLNMCSSQSACSEESQNDLFGYLFCIEKVNMPGKQKRKRVSLPIYCGLRYCVKFCVFLSVLNFSFVAVICIGY